jgi:hypothetical protein
VQSIEINHSPVEVARPGEDVALKVNSRVRVGDGVYVLSR